MAGFGRRDAVVGDWKARPAGRALILAGSRALWNQAEQARATATLLRVQSLRAKTQSLTVYGQAADAYADACTARQAATIPRPAASGQDAAPDFDGFQVEGVIDGQPVAATLTRGRLVCDPALRARAELLVDLGEVFCDETGRPRYVASLDGPEVAVALTLVRACDRVLGFGLAIPGLRAANGPGQADAMP